MTWSSHKSQNHDQTRVDQPLNSHQSLPFPGVPGHLPAGHSPVILWLFITEKWSCNTCNLGRGGSIRGKRLILHNSSCNSTVSPRLRVFNASICCIIFIVVGWCGTTSHRHFSEDTGPIWLRVLRWSTLTCSMDTGILYDLTSPDMVSLPTPFHSLQPPGTPGTAGTAKCKRSASLLLPNTTWKHGDRMGETIAAQQLKIWPNMAASKHTMRDTCSECRCCSWVMWNFQRQDRLRPRILCMELKQAISSIIKRCKMVCTKSMWGIPSDFSRGSTGLSSQIGIEQTFEPSSATKQNPFGAFCSGPNPWFLSIKYQKMHIISCLTSPTDPETTANKFRLKKCGLNSRCSAQNGNHGTSRAKRSPR